MCGREKYLFQDRCKRRTLGLFFQYSGRGTSQRSLPEVLEPPGRFYVRDGVGHSIPSFDPDFVGERIPEVFEVIVLFVQMLDLIQRLAYGHLCRIGSGQFELRLTLESDVDNDSQSSNWLQQI